MKAFSNSNIGADRDLERLFQQIAALGRENGASKIIVFGSRARGDCRPNSDIDLAVYGMPKENQGRFWLEIDDLPTLLNFDIVHITDKTERPLLENIKKDGLCIMSKLKEKYDKLAQAVKRLEEAIRDYEETPRDSIRDGVIQRFEFCTELAWKTIREYLLDEGYTDINSPKAVMRQAYADGLIQQEQLWINLLNDRNRTSHIYDEDTADQVYRHIVNDYAGLFHQVIDKLKGTV